MVYYRNPACRKETIRLKYCQITFCFLCDAIVYYHTDLKSIVQVRKYGEKSCYTKNIHEHAANTHCS